MKFVLIEPNIEKTRFIFKAKANEHLVIAIWMDESVDCQVEARLSSQNARIEILGIIIGKNANNLKLHTLQKHEAPNTFSDLSIKSALWDQSKFVYQGMIRIEKQAQKSNAYQRNDNLILSELAHAESQPSLEILANDVRCTHGATLGKIDDDQIFYLQSRGLQKDEAQKLIISGFLKTVIDRVSDQDIKNKLLAKLKKTLEE